MGLHYTARNSLFRALIISANLIPIAPHHTFLDPVSLAQCKPSSNNGLTAIATPTFDVVDPEVVRTKKNKDDWCRDKSEAASSSKKAIMRLSHSVKQNVKRSKSEN